VTIWFCLQLLLREINSSNARQYAMRRGLLHVESRLPAHGVFPDADLIERQSLAAVDLRSFHQARTRSSSSRQPCDRRLAGSSSVAAQGIAPVGAVRLRRPLQQLAYELHL
jgi:hypothetical protein